jgi:hypothetical protein
MSGRARGEGTGNRGDGLGSTPQSLTRSAMIVSFEPTIRLTVRPWTTMSTTLPIRDIAEEAARIEIDCSQDVVLP